jgi:hypothetical protein
MIIGETLPPPLPRTSTMRACLWVEAADELVQALGAHVGDVEVTDFAVGLFGNVGDVGVDKLLVVERGFVADGDDGDVAGAFVGGLRVNPKHDLFADGADEGGENIGEVAHGAAVDGEDVVAGRDVNAEFGEG